MSLWHRRHSKRIKCIIIISILSKYGLYLQELLVYSVGRRKTHSNGGRLGVIRSVVLLLGRGGRSTGCKGAACMGLGHRLCWFVSVLAVVVVDFHGLCLRDFRWITWLLRVTVVGSCCQESWRLSRSVWVVWVDCGCPNSRCVWGMNWTVLSYRDWEIRLPSTSWILHMISRDCLAAQMKVIKVLHLHQWHGSFHSRHLRCKVMVISFTQAKSWSVGSIQMTMRLCVIRSLTIIFPILALVGLIFLHWAL